MRIPSPSFTLVFAFVSVVFFGGCRQKKISNLSAGEQPLFFSDQLPRKWAKTSLPVTFHISEDFSKKEIHSIREQALIWERGVDHELDFFHDDFPIVKNFDPLDPNDYRDDLERGAEFGIYRSEKWFDEFGADTLAVTQFFGPVEEDDDGHYIRIEQADIILNYRDHFFSILPTKSDFDLLSVVVHEFGHFLGLKHNVNSFYPSVMLPSISRRVYRRRLSWDDIDDIRHNYGLSPLERPVEEKVGEEEAAVGVEKRAHGDGAGLFDPHDHYRFEYFEQRMGPSGDYVRGVIELKAQEKTSGLTTSASCGISCVRCP
ncbi:MAG: matrixin family metalloprotease [Bacteriovoracales bacterium]|nr:matrixin family metalloprotease [Bacteriovoracales bacterium]